MVQVLDDCDTFTFRITGIGEYLSPRQNPVRYIDLPSREDALALYKDYLEHTSSHIANTLHSPTVHSIIHELYTQLNQGQKVDLSSVALILSFFASSAFFWDKGFPSAFNFLTEENAAAQSNIWRGAAFDLLDQCQRAAMNSLDSIQAGLVLADLVYNMEGTSSRFRYIHSGARATACGLGLHLIDLPGSESGDSEFRQEMKRRIWWYIAATDWYYCLCLFPEYTLSLTSALTRLLCATGGAMDRVYTVNPKHMRVNLPKYIPEDDQLFPMYGAWSEIVVLHVNIRIRLGEVCRQIADALPLGSGGIETLPFANVAALDGLYEQILTDLPSIFSYPDEHNSADEVARRVVLQRALGKLSLHARRARLLRPLLQANNLPLQFDVLRKRCLDSTELVIDIASTILSEAVDSSGSIDSRIPKSARRSPYRGGLVINHLFMACAVLATDPALRGGGAEDSSPDAGTERRRAALANACRLLEKAGEKSAMAASMVQRLVSCLRRHRVHGVETGGHRQVGSGSFAAPDQGSAQKPQSHIPGAEEMTTEPSSLEASHQQAVPPSWGCETMDPNGLGGIWNDFLGTNPTDYGWQQLFADLDSFAGSSVY